MARSLGPVGIVRFRFRIQWHNNNSNGGTKRAP